MMRWGIAPWFANSELEFKKLSTVNAQSDRLTDSKMCREPFAKRRCRVPASGYPPFRSPSRLSAALRPRTRRFAALTDTWAPGAGWT
jgi:putative SOS response-associated peptidase YedK